MIGKGERNEMKPLIGVTPSFDDRSGSYKVSRNNLQAIEAAGGIPLVMPYLTEKEMIDEVVAKIDGLYLTGGHDIDPIYLDEEPHPKLGVFQPERDAFELTVTEKMLEKNKPVFGVCKGSQILNVATGGGLYQDIASQIEGELVQHMQKAESHFPAHGVEIVEGTFLHRLIGQNKIRVNSFHHQAIRHTGNNFKVSAKAQDGVIEAIESTVHSFALGVQWHPEIMAVKGNDEVSKNIFRSFIAACQENKAE